MNPINVFKFFTTNHATFGVNLLGQLHQRCAWQLQETFGSYNATPVG
jgi:hypothetical protein